MFGQYEPRIKPHGGPPFILGGRTVRLVNTLKIRQKAVVSPQAGSAALRCLGVHLPSAALQDSVPQHHLAKPLLSIMLWVPPLVRCLERELQLPTWADLGKRSSDFGTFSHLMHVRDTFWVNLPGRTQICSNCSVILNIMQLACAHI